MGQSPPDPSDIYEVLRDKTHQPYRQQLVPGLAKVLEEIIPSSYPGLLGVFLSGAGPTIIALATDNFHDIAKAIASTVTKASNKGCSWQLMQPALDGATVGRGDD